MCDYNSYFNRTRQNFLDQPTLFFVTSTINYIYTKAKNRTTMPKRKRNSEPSLYDKLTKHLDEVSRALKAAKGFERQRLSKRTHEAGATAEKKERLEREISVLKVSSCPTFLHWLHWILGLMEELLGLIEEELWGEGSL